jgi:hypothetical protein
MENLQMCAMSTEQCISVIEELGRRIRTIEWGFRSTEYTLSSADDLNSIADKQLTFREGTFLIEVGSARHRGQITMISRWHQGAAPYIGHKIWVSFDGVQYRMGTRLRHGAEVPLDTDFSYGEIDERPKDYPGRWQFDAGMIYLAPFFHSYDHGMQTLSDTLRCKNDHGLEFLQRDDEPAIWSIAFQDGCETARLEYCPSKGVVRSVVWGGGEPFRVFRRRVAEGFMEVPGSFWAPTAVRSMYIPCGGAPVMTRTEYFDVKVNSPVKDADYQVDLPVGMQVDDHIAERTYRIGQEIDEPTAIRRYRERNSHRFTE